MIALCRCPIFFSFTLIFVGSKIIVVDAVFDAIAVLFIAIAIVNFSVIVSVFAIRGSQYHWRLLAQSRVLSWMHTPHVHKCLILRFDFGGEAFQADDMDIGTRK